jgi:tetratricopeptide (TPR) repeat protein
MTRLWGAILSVAVVSATAPIALAQPTPPQSAEEQSKAKFLAGKQSFRLGEFDEAIALWKEAYRLNANPAFLFNIGLAYREKGDLPHAVQFLENYLKDAPANAANRGEVEARVKELKKLIEDQKAAQKRPPSEPVDMNGDSTTGTGTGTTGIGTGTDTSTTGADATRTAQLTTTPLDTTTEEPMDTGGGGGGGLKIAGIATGGVGVVLLGTGIVFGMKAKSAQDDVQAAIDNGDVWTEELDQKDADGRSAAKLSTITLGVGAAAVVGGGVLFYLGLQKGKTESSGMSLVPSGRGLSVVGRF